MGKNTAVKNVNGNVRPRKLYDAPDDEKLELKLDSITSKAKTPCFVYVLTFFSALGGFLFGYDTGVISGAMILLRRHFSLSSLWQELVVSVTLAAAAVFALVGGCLNDRLGRRTVIMTASIIFSVGAVCMGISIDKYMLLTGRIVIGAGIGLTSTTIPMYLAECTPPHIRGRLVSTHIAMVAGGQFIASVLDGIFGWNKKNGWRYMLGLAGIPAFVQFVGFIFMPESPRWLITSGQEVKARRVLQAMRGQLDIDEEFESIKNSCHEAEQAEHASGHKPVIVQMLQTPAVRRALLIGCGLQIIQQVVGINTVLYYSATIIHMTGVKGDEAAIWLAAVTACAYFLFTILGLYLVEKIGRRALTLGSLMGAILSLGWLAVGFQLSSQNTPHMTLTELPILNSTCGAYSTCNQCMLDLNCGFCYVDNGNAGISNSSCLPADYDNPWSAKSGRCKKSSDKSDVTWAYDYCPTPYSWMPMVGLVLYLVFFAPGMGPMPWTINSEIYPLWARSTGNAAATFFNWVFNLAVSMSFISMTETLTRFGTFLLYAGLACIGLLLLFLFLPETKGKALEEVEGVFAQPWCGGVHTIEYNTKTIQYVHIRGLNRDGRESELDSPE